jgi:hypothetical protein
VFADGSNDSAAAYVGGLAGNVQEIGYSSSTVSVTDPSSDLRMGGLAGAAQSISFSFAAGTVSGGNNLDGISNFLGGLVGLMTTNGVVSSSYALSNVQSAGNGSEVGGLIGGLPGSVYKQTQAYSTGLVQGVSTGGFVGEIDSETVSFKYDYWDKNTSGQRKAIGYDTETGQSGNARGIKGETTAELKSGLPDGFDPNIWSSNPSLNNGYPYLLANPPPQ